MNTTSPMLRKNVVEKQPWMYPGKYMKRRYLESEEDRDNVHNSFLLSKRKKQEKSVEDDDFPGSNSTSANSSSPSASPFASDYLSCSSNNSLSDERHGNILVTTVNNFCQQMESFNNTLIDFPCLASEEIDRLLGSVNDFENFQLHPPLTNGQTAQKPRNDKSAFRNIQEISEIQDELYQEELTYPSFVEESEEILLADSSIEDIIIPSEEDKEKSSTCPEASEGKLHYDSESTITGSETEMYQAELARKKSESRKRYSKRIPKKPKYLEDSLDVFESDDEDDIQDEDSCPEDETAEGCKKLSRNSYLFGLCPSYLKSIHDDNEAQEYSSEKSLKPWWPKTFFLNDEMNNLDTDTNDASMILNLRKLKKHKSTEGLHALMKNEQRLLGFIGRIWKKRRQRKQLELWQFILKRLDSQASPLSPSTSTVQSPFKWVDRSAGVFRIIDTRLAAEEWGKYRNNSRMDYEKMARAMRFYYKHSILRKARLQLHFQFAMPFVEWFQLHSYLLKS